MRLAEILATAEVAVEASTAKEPVGSLREALEGWLAKRRRDKDLKRSTVEDYEELFERLYRDLGAETPVDELQLSTLRLTSRTSRPNGCSPRQPLRRHSPKDWTSGK